MWFYENLPNRTKTEIDVAYDLLNKRIRELAIINSITTAKLASTVYGFMGGTEKVNWLPTEEKELDVSDRLLREILDMNFDNTGDFKPMVFSLFFDRLKDLDNEEHE